MVMGWDDALYAAVAAYGAYSSQQNTRSTNATNTAINAFNAEQAQDFFNASQKFNHEEIGQSRDFDREMTFQSQKYNAEQAGENRAFQERMSNTQYQRATADAMSAGLNPMLTVSQGGAGNMGGSAASAGVSSHGAATSPGGQVPGKIPMQVAPNITQSLLSSAQAASTTRKAQAETENIEANTALTKARVPESVMHAQQMSKEIDRMEEDIKLKIAQTGHSMMSKATEYARGWLVKAQEDVETMKLQVMKGDIDYKVAATKMMQINAKLGDYDIAAGAGKYKLDSSEYGQSAGREILKEGADLAGTVARGRGSFGRWR